MGNILKNSVAIRIPPLLIFFVCLGLDLSLEYVFSIHLISLSLIPHIIAGCIAISSFMVLVRHKTPFSTAKATTNDARTGRDSYPNLSSRIASIHDLRL